MKTHNDGQPLTLSEHPKPKLFSKWWWKSILYFFRKPRLTVNNLEKTKLKKWN